MAAAARFGRLRPDPASDWPDPPPRPPDLLRWPLGVPGTCASGRCAVSLTTKATTSGMRRPQPPVRPRGAARRSCGGARSPRCDGTHGRHTTAALAAAAVVSSQWRRGVHRGGQTRSAGVVSIWRGRRVGGLQGAGVCDLCDGVSAAPW
ncbi:hypothetical protein GQ55_4G289400 [Panicum hallii var. hallii]|uniref:Uncharacterized protein n=1 Tax=Panicum hallii var. hallii TaxID=1504633 RepID=A0A2T7E190_9POAL|nr:hypothetical protein GQ55_4G289400 [Panicum hallii var. hallii]